MKIMVMDGQGGRLGQCVVSSLKQKIPDGGADITAVGTNSIATAAMMRAGADSGATGENPVVVGAKGADVIVGPIGILAADSLLGEVTPAMAVAVGQSPAQKILIPINRCNNTVVGTQPLSMSEMVERAADMVVAMLREKR